MSLRVIDERCRREGAEAVICLESTDREELTGYEAGHTAVKAAAAKFNVHNGALATDEGAYRPMPDADPYFGRPAESEADFKLLEQHRLLKGGKLLTWRRDLKVTTPF